MRRRADDGFTLIELLVVMIIIGILASIAIPVFLSQRGKAHDAAVKADVRALGDEVYTYFVDHAGPLTLTSPNPHEIDLSDGAYTTVARLTVGSVQPTTGASSHLDDAGLWCVALTDPNGTSGIWQFSAMSGLQKGPCA